MIAYFRTFLLFLALVVLPAHGGKRGLKVYPKKDENSDDYLMLQNWRKLLRDMMLMYTISIEKCGLWKRISFARCPRNSRIKSGSDLDTSEIRISTMISLYENVWIIYQFVHNLDVYIAWVYYIFKNVDYATWSLSEMLTMWTIFFFHIENFKLLFRLKSQYLSFGSKKFGTKFLVLRNSVPNFLIWEIWYQLFRSKKFGTNFLDLTNSVPTF